MTEGVPLLNRILLALSYSAQFQYPLLPYEVWCQLLCASEKKYSYLQVVRSLHLLSGRKLVQSHRGLYVLNGNVGYVAQRLARKQFSMGKRFEARSLLWFLSVLPWVQAVAITGSVAVQNAELDDDLDFCIVVESGSLWLVRPIVVLFAWLRGKRRSWRSEEHNSWCFNLWLDQSSLQVSHAARSVYTAREVLQADWVIDRGNIQSQFLRANAWVATVFPNWYTKRLRGTRITGDPSLLFAVFAFFLETTKPVWVMLNYVLFGLQKLYMQSHQTRERVALQYAYFHPRDTRAGIADAWREQILQIQANASGVALIHSMHSAGSVPTEVLNEISTVRWDGKKIVLVTGVFDVLHEEHVVFLEKAALLGDYLLVAIESDERVRQIKGEGRPVNSGAVRADQLKNIPVVSNVLILPAVFSKPEQHQQFLAQIRPDFFAVSSHTAHLDKKRRAVGAVGGSLVVVHEYIAGVSTTDLVDNERYT